jgi:hypothetical protein
LSDRAGIDRIIQSQGMLWHQSFSIAYHQLGIIDILETVLIQNVNGIQHLVKEIIILFIIPMIERSTPKEKKKEIM